MHVRNRSRPPDGRPDPLPIGDAFRQSVLPAGAHEPAATIVTLLLLVAGTLGAGLFARSAAGRKMFLRIETAFLLRLPYYTVFRTMIRQHTAAPEDAAAWLLFTMGRRELLYRA